jgi:chromosome partitioning protein
LHGLELAKVVMAAHAILIPVCNSIFDRESAAACIAELMALPRLAGGRCKLGVVGMRIDARTHAAQTLRAWADGLQVPFLGVLRETQSYVRSLDSGQTIFDVAGSAGKPDREQWEPILRWLHPVTQLPASPSKWDRTFGSANEPSLSVAANDRIPAPRAPSLMPAQESLVHGSRLSVFASGHALLRNTVATPRVAGEPQVLGAPQFLLRQ